MPVHCHPRFPSRNRRFPDRCRSPDCASTAFRCRCLLLRQKLFVLPCRRLRNNYILCPTGTPTFAAARRQRRDLIIATRPAHQPLPSLLSAAAGAGAISRPGASAFFVSDGPISSNSGRNGGKNAGRNCVSALPQRAMPVHCHPRFPSRNRRFPDRCRSPDCASTAFRCRCLLLRQKLFVLPCRRLRNNYILCPTGTPTFAAARRQRRDLIIATRPAHQPLPSLLSAAAAQAVQAIPEPTTMSPTAPIPRDQHRQICTCPPRAKGP